MDRWAEELVAEHWQEWRNEGFREGAASLTIRQLIHRFGPLDSALEESVRNLSFEELERLGEELLDFPSKSALIEWLDRFGRPQ